MINFFKDRLGRFLGIRLEYFLMGSFWLSLGQASTMASAFLLSLAYARFIPKSVYGDYRYVLSVLSIAGIFAVPGIATSITRGVARGYDGTFRRGARMIFLSSFGVSCVGLALASILFHRGTVTLAWGFIVVALAVPMIEGLGNWRGYYDGKKAFRAKTILNILDQAFYLATMATAVLLILLLHLRQSISLIILLLAYSLGEGLPNVFFFWNTFKRIPSDAPEEPGSLRYGIHLSIVNIPSTVANYLDAVLIHAFIGPTALAVYSFALAPIDQLKGFFSAWSDLTFPRLSEKNSFDTVKKTLPKQIFKTSLFTLGFIALYIILAPFVFKILFPHYQDSVTFTRVLALSLILFPFSIFNNALKAEGNIKKVYTYNIAAPMIQIAALAILIPIWGLWGAVLARLIGRLSNYLLPYILFVTN